MPGPKPRILVGRMYHESNVLPRYETGGENFTEHRGDDLLRLARGSGSTLGGICDRAEELGYDLVAALDVWAPPGALVAEDYYQAVKAEFLEHTRVGGFDMIALELHGAMGTASIPDAEGDLLAALRTEVGPRVPIGVGLDLHAHLTPRMLEHGDIVIACKENPHADVVNCGRKIIDGLHAMREGRLKPTRTLARVPMILMGSAETNEGPLADLHARARDFAADHPTIRDISLYNVNRFTDDVDMGQCVAVLSDDDAPTAEIIAEELAAEFWRRREEFRDDLLTVDQALDLSANPVKPLPIAMGDMGDRTTAGAPGDSIEILKVALCRPGLRGAIPITDAAAVAQAKAVGTGGILRCTVGGRLTPFFEPLPIEGIVRHLSNGEFIFAGPYQRGVLAEMGDTAVLDLQNGMLLLLTSRPSHSLDPQTFESQGIRVAEQDFLVVKSGHHFKLNFAGLARPVVVATPGLGYPFRGYHPGKRARFFPEHEVAEPRVRAVHFRPRS